MERSWDAGGAKNSVALRKRILLWSLWLGNYLEFGAWYLEFNG